MRTIILFLLFCISIFGLSYAEQPYLILPNGAEPDTTLTVPIQFSEPHPLEFTLSLIGDRELFSKKYIVSAENPDISFKLPAKEGVYTLKFLSKGWEFSKKLQVVSRPKIELQLAEILNKKGSFLHLFVKVSNSNQPICKISSDDNRISETLQLSPEGQLETLLPLGTAPFTLKLQVGESELSRYIIPITEQIYIYSFSPFYSTNVPNIFKLLLLNDRGEPVPNHNLKAKLLSITDNELISANLKTGTNGFSAFKLTPSEKSKNIKLSITDGAIKREKVLRYSYDRILELFPSNLPLEQNVGFTVTALSLNMEPISTKAVVRAGTFSKFLEIKNGVAYFRYTPKAGKFENFTLSFVDGSGVKRVKKYRFPVAKERSLSVWTEQFFLTPEGKLHLNLSYSSENPILLLEYADGSCDAFHLKKGLKFKDLHYRSIVGKLSVRLFDRGNYSKPATLYIKSVSSIKMPLDSINLTSGEPLDLSKLNLVYPELILSHLPYSRSLDYLSLFNIESNISLAPLDRVLNSFSLPDSVLQGYSRIFSYPEYSCLFEFPYSAADEAPLLEWLPPSDQSSQVLPVELFNGFLSCICSGNLTNSIPITIFEPFSISSPFFDFKHFYVGDRVEIPIKLINNSPNRYSAEMMIQLKQGIEILSQLNPIIQLPPFKEGYAYYSVAFTEPTSTSFTISVSADSISKNLRGEIAIAPKAYKKSCSTAAILLKSCELKIPKEEKVSIDRGRVELYGSVRSLAQQSIKRAKNRLLTQKDLLAIDFIKKEFGIDEKSSDMSIPFKFTPVQMELFSMSHMSYERLTPREKLILTYVRHTTSELPAPNPNEPIEKLLYLYLSNKLTPKSVEPIISPLSKGNCFFIPSSQPLFSNGGSGIAELEATSLAILLLPAQMLTPELRHMSASFLLSGRLHDGSWGNMLTTYWVLKALKRLFPTPVTAKVEVNSFERTLSVGDDFKIVQVKDGTERVNLTTSSDFPIFCFLISELYKATPMAGGKYISSTLPSRVHRGTPFDWKIEWNHPARELFLIELPVPWGVSIDEKQLDRQLSLKQILGYRRVQNRIFVVVPNQGELSICVMPIFKCAISVPPVRVESLENSAIFGESLFSSLNIED